MHDATDRPASHTREAILHAAGISRLREFLEYSPETGVFTWLQSVSNVHAGDVAGHARSDGYMTIRVYGRRYYAHQLAWAFTHGVWADGHIDHIDGNPSNNCASNLRAVHPQVNYQNRRNANPSNRSGSSVPGVCFDPSRGKFDVYGKLAGKSIRIGRFALLADAEQASIAWRRANYKGNTL